MTCEKQPRGTEAKIKKRHKTKVNRVIRARKNIREKKHNTFSGYKKGGNGES